MFTRTHFKIIAGFVGVTFFIGVISLAVSSSFAKQSVFTEATTRIAQDLNAAWEIWDHRRASMLLVLEAVASGDEIRSAIIADEGEGVRSRLQDAARLAQLDFAGVVSLGASSRSSEPRLLANLGNTPTGDTLRYTPNPAVGLAIERRTSVSGAVVLTRGMLASEDAGLVERAYIPLVETPRSSRETSYEQTSGLCIISVVPIYDGFTEIGVLYGGVLLNRDTTIVDRVRETVFRDEVYEGRSIGTATIFFEDVRVSTNVRTDEGVRALGTRVSEEVRNTVLEEGFRWSDRAFVVNDWYITAYDPIIDVFGNRVGMLYVGVLEEKYDDTRRRTELILVGFLAAGVLVALGFGYFQSARIVRPINRLTAAARQVSAGNLDPDLGRAEKGEIGVLQAALGDMVDSIKERDRKLQAASDIKLIQSERQASVGRLAAGVAHEINNPLTGVLTFTHMLLRREQLDPEMRADLERIARATERVRDIVKGLLDFSRQTELEPVDTDINEFISEIIPLLENQALVKGIRFCFDPGDDIPRRRIDKTQMQSVVMNIIINAIDATGAGGHVIISTAVTASSGESPKHGIEIAVEDTGCGIPAEHLSKLFDPFFTTKDVGEGTGLGLAVSFGIVERHGGTIRVKSRIGVGSTFYIWLPVEES